MRALITPPVDVIRDRLAFRTANDFGKDSGELDRTIALIESIEPLIRRSANVVIDTNMRLDEVVARVLEISRPN